MDTAIGKSGTPVQATFWDRLGIGLSILCMVHCLALPLVLTWLTATAAADAFHLWMALVLVPVVLLAAIPSYRIHRRPTVLWLFAGGVVLLFGALLLEPVVGEIGERTITIAGGALLVAGHWINWRSRPHRHHA